MLKLINARFIPGARKETVAWLTRLCAFAVIVASAQLMMSQAAQADSDDGNSNWPSAGQNLDNTRFQIAEKSISVKNVSGLFVKWTFTTQGDVSATPSVDEDHVYFPDWKGFLYAVDRKKGAQVWRTKIEAATGVAGDFARATPLIAGNKLIVGTQGGPQGGGGKLLAFDRKSGKLLWKTTLDEHPAAIVTQSANVVGNTVFVGVASSEETFAAFIPEYVCCSFRGSMLAINAETGAILWKTYTVPTGYSGGAVWGSSPAIDPERHQVYIATGNNYTVPDAVLACVARASDTNSQRACISKDDFFDSIMALDLKTGAVRWSFSALPYDTWTLGCLGMVFGLPVSNCPTPSGPDYDFGQAPALFKVQSDEDDKMGDRRRDGDRPRELVGAGQKSGTYWALNPDNGALVWKTQAGPGGTTGGLQWGSAADHSRVYTADANSLGTEWVLPNGSRTRNGIWSGLDAATGKILWQATPAFGGGASGPVTTANGVVFGCSLDPLGYMYALNGATGQMLWSFASGGGCLSGAAISRGTVYWGSGYSRLSTPNNKLYAFTLPGQHE